MYIDSEVRCIDPFTQGEIILRIKKAEIYKALIFLYLNTECDELDNSLTLITPIVARSKNKLHQRWVKLVDTIYQFTLDGLIEPKDFDIALTYKKIATYIKHLKEKEPSRFKVLKEIFLNSKGITVS
jgi:hypothetical protein